MAEIEDRAQFPFTVKQDRPDYCIPASIQAVSKYLNRGFNLTQEEIMKKYYDHKGPTQPSFKAMREHLLTVDAQFASWIDSEEISGLPDFETFVQRLKATIDSRVPQIVSVPILLPGDGGVDGYHMLTVVKYDQENFEVHDPYPYQDIPNPRLIPIEKLRSYLLLANSGVPDSLVLRRRST
jgi:Peptidase_C39 like family